MNKGEYLREWIASNWRDLNRYEIELLEEVADAMDEPGRVFTGGGRLGPSDE